MNLDCGGPLELGLREFRYSLKEVIGNSHRTHSVGTRRSWPDLVELFERGHDRPLRFLDHFEIGRKTRGRRSRRRLGGLFRRLRFRAPCEQCCGRCAQNSTSQVSSGKQGRGISSAGGGGPARVTPRCLAGFARALNVAEHFERIVHRRFHLYGIRPCGPRNSVILPEPKPGTRLLWMARIQNPRHRSDRALYRTDSTFAVCLMREHGLARQTASSLQILV